MFLNRRGTRSTLMLSPLHLTGGFGERTNERTDLFSRFKGFIQEVASDGIASAQKKGQGNKRVHVTNVYPSGTKSDVETS